MLFFLIAAMTIAGALVAMTMRNAVHCILGLTLAFVGIATLYLELGAQFVGFTQVLVYVGAVAILAVFAIMTTHGGDESKSTGTRRRITWSACSAVSIASGIFALLVWCIKACDIGRKASVQSTDVSVGSIGDALMSAYAIPLEVIGLLLTAAMVGAVIVAMPERGGKR